MTKVDNKVGDVLRGRVPVLLTAEKTVREAAVLLSDHNIGAAPVLAGDRLVGIFSERDILQRVVAAGRNADAMRVAEAMTPDPRTVTPEAWLGDALVLMREGQFRHLPVVDGDGRVIAMLSMRDISSDIQFMYLQWSILRERAPKARTISEEGSHLEIIVDRSPEGRHKLVEG